MLGYPIQKKQAINPMMDQIFIQQLRLPARIGVYETEKVAPQEVVLDITLTVNIQGAAAHDRLEDTIDYAELIKQLASHCLAQHVQLVERLAQQLADICLQDKRVQQVALRLGKPHAIAQANSVGVSIVRNQTP